MFGWFKKTPKEPVPERTDLVQIPAQVPLPEDAICFFDPFDVVYRRKELKPQLAKYDNVKIATVADAHTPQDEGHIDGEETPAEKWDDDGVTSSSNGGGGDCGDQSPAGAEATSAESEEVIPANEQELIALIEKEKTLCEELRAVLGLPPSASSGTALELQPQHKLNCDLLRFLRARNYKVVDAAEMYKKMLEWRETAKIDGMLDTPDPHEAMIQSFCGHRNHGFGYGGHPVYYERTGLVRVAEMLKYCTEEDIVMRHVRHMEYAMRRCQFSSMANELNVGKIIMIHDLAHLKFTVETVGVKIFKKTVAIDQQMYPERLHMMFIINAPLSFRGVWAVVKPFIDPKTSKKIKILGGNYQESLLKHIPLSELPEMYGGNCRCEYPNGDQCIPWVRPWPTEDLSAVPDAWPRI